MESLKGYKTYITGAIAILSAVGGYLTKDISTGEAMQLVFASLSTMFLRSGIANK